MDNSFPYIIDGTKITDTDKWLSDNRDSIESLINSNGAVLFRGFPLSSRENLKSFLYKLIPPELFQDYTGGTSPREQLEENLYTSTKMPFFLKIPLHSEMAYRKRFPERIFFYCEKAPAFGGETPIVDLRKVNNSIPEEINAKLIDEEVTYYRHLKNFTPLRKFLSKLNPMIETGTWQHVFKTHDPEVVNSYCKRHFYIPDWQKDGSVILKTTLPALNKNIWFNSFHFFQVHHRIWGRVLTALFKTLLSMTGSKNLSATTGKGNRLSTEEISLIVDAYEKNMIKFKWQEGDLLYLNNTLTAHGRSPFIGRRKILVALAKESEFQDFEK